MLTPKKSREAFTRFMEQKDKLNTENFCLGALGSTLYSDFTARSNAIHRDDTLELWSGMVKEASEAFEGVMVDTGNIYAAMYADYVANAAVQGISADTVMGHHGVGIFWNVADWTLE